ncbi:Uncharacterised protein [Klebsiella pneumoniae]|nr:Uncharacterised protein [Klebsiella pneumoniae]
MRLGQFHFRLQIFLRCPQFVVSALLDGLFCICAGCTCGRIRMPLVISLHLQAIQCSATFRRICKAEKILNIRIVTVYCLANRRPQCILANKDIRIAETLRCGSYAASQRRNLQPLFDLPGPDFNHICQIIRNFPTFKLV